MNVKVNVQVALPDSRPSDASLHIEEMFLDISALPQIGDHIDFSDKEAGGEGVFKVRSRLFTYALDKGKYFVSFVNIVVENDSTNYPLLEHD